MKIALRLISGLFIFVGPIVVILTRYESEKSTTTEEGLSFFATIIIVLVIFAFVGFVLSNFQKVLRDDKFGTLSLITYGSILLSLFVLSGVVMNWVVNSAQASVETFVENMNYHLNTIYLSAFLIVIGIMLLSIEIIAKIKGD